MFYILLIIVLYCIWRIPTMKLQNLIYKFIFSQNLQDQDSLLFIFFFFSKNQIREEKRPRSRVRYVQTGWRQSIGEARMAEQTPRKSLLGRSFIPSTLVRQVSTRAEDLSTMSLGQTGDFCKALLHL